MTDRRHRVCGKPVKIASDEKNLPFKAQVSPPPAAVLTAKPGTKRRRSRSGSCIMPKVQQLYTVLQQRWPRTFGEDAEAIRPLAIGIDRDIVAQLSEYPRWAVKQALTRWLRTHQVRYWQALLQGGPRYDLEGQVRGEVTAEQQARAQQQRAEWFARRGLAQGQTVGRPERPSQPRPKGSE